MRTDRTRKFPVALTLLLLNRGGRLYKNTFFTELERLGFSEILSVEGPAVSYDVETLARKFTSIRFLVLHEAASRGEQINIGMDEANGEYVFVMWNDMKIAPASMTSRLIERVRENGSLCTVPLIQNQKLETIPTIMAPAFYNKMLKVLPLQPTADGMMSLFPFDYSGIYSKERFVLTGGYDYGLQSPYWQKMDFGFRSYMWGEKIGCNTSLRMSYLGEVPSEDATPDESYKYFFLKNLSIRFSADTGTLPYARFPEYWLKSGGFFGAMHEFRRARRWVEINKFRFKQDARGITELWEVPEV
ncbi:MAG TPA: hypothetical protein VMW69_00785 [Spirochaetia bacterium]|nr:hypothetical protein [Spirochaetia bacterium]